MCMIQISKLQKGIYREHWLPFPPLLPWHPLLPSWRRLLLRVSSASFQKHTMRTRASVKIPLILMCCPSSSLAVQFESMGHYTGSAIPCPSVSTGIIFIMKSHFLNWKATRGQILQFVKFNLATVFSALTCLQLTGFHCRTVVGEES